MKKLSEHLSETAANNDTDPEVEIDDAKKKQLNKIWEKMVSHPLYFLIPLFALIVGIVGLTFTFFQINVKTVKPISGSGIVNSPEVKIPPIETISSEELDITKYLPSERETRKYSLKNKNDVENEGGEVHNVGDENFADSGCPTQGFISKKVGDVVFFHIIPSGFRYLYEGALAFCVTLDKLPSDSVSFFRIHEEHGVREPHISLKLMKDMKVRLRLRGWSLEEKCTLSSDPVNWQVGEHYHVTGTWGPAGMKLYIDGELIKENEVMPKDVINKHIDFKDGVFVVNNEESDDDKWDKETNCIISNLQVSNYQLSDRKVEEYYSELHTEK